MTCPKCGTTYTHSKTGIPQEAGRVATIVCDKCGKQFDVTVLAEQKWQWFWIWPFLRKHTYTVKGR